LAGIQLFVIYPNKIVCIIAPLTFPYIFFGEASFLNLQGSYFGKYINGNFARFKKHGHPDLGFDPIFRIYSGFDFLFDQER
jgi:hypothetical protein